MGEQVGAKSWGCSSVGRASALQAGGQGFEALHLHVDSEESKRADAHLREKRNTCISEIEQMSRGEDARRASVTK